MIPAIAAILALAIALPTLAQEYRCNEAGNQAELNACASDAYKAADKKLNATYKAAIAKLDGTAREALRSEQRTWLKKLDPACKHAADDEAKGGSMWPMVYQYCLADRTEKRITELKK